MTSTNIPAKVVPRFQFIFLQAPPALPEHTCGLGAVLAPKNRDYVGAPIRSTLASNPYPKNLLARRINKSDFTDMISYGQMRLFGVGDQFPIDTQILYGHITYVLLRAKTREMRARKALARYRYILEYDILSRDWGSGRE